ncbi:hypothetical protein [Modestobacter sp. Leaf380]|uniref:hypothetical protein n=1 Tax=Modestobacter sp. Leaf380 TaxID=1736356 RepID=UPI0006FFAC93|nr:hypothetical protein [Modestobacter sp. Leaf380]KQS64985.1 hypothetical protein ASG41_16300 [Modestobacter sp. Leaf380]
MRGRGGTPELDGHSLLGTARLLTGSPGAGADLLVRVLARRPATREAALARLVRAHRGRHSGLGRNAGSIDAEVPTDAWWVSPADVSAARATEAALDRLTLDQRTVLVLTHAEQLDPGAVGRLVPGAAGLLRSAEAQVAAEVPDPADLPARLDGVLALDGSPDGAGLLLPLRVRAARRSRRLRWATASAVAAALVVGSVLVPGDGGPAESPAAAPSTATATPAEETSVSDGSVTFFPLEPSAAPASPLLTLGTRGSLAGDQAYLDALLEAAGPVLLGTPVATRRVLFAGDVGDQRVALVVGENGLGVLQTWYAGPIGAPVDQLQQDGGAQGPLLHSVAGVVGDPGLFIALVVPGDTVEYSPGVALDATGTAVREWRTVESADGVLVGPAGKGGTTASYRVVRPDGSQAEVGEAWGAFGWSGDPVTGPAPPALRAGPGRDPVQAQVFTAALHEVLLPTGISADQLRVSVLWSGEVPSSSGQPADVVVLAVVLPNGAVVTTTAWSVTTGGYGSTGGCGSTGHPAGTDPATLTVVARCDVWADGDQPLSSLVVTAPAGTGTVTLGAGDGGPDVPIRLSRGWAVAREPDAGLTTVTAPTPGRVSAAGAGDLWDV